MINIYQFVMISLGNLTLGALARKSYHIFPVYSKGSLQNGNNTWYFYMWYVIQLILFINVQTDPKKYVQNNTRIYIFDHIEEIQ